MRPTQSNGSNARVCSTTCPCALVITSRTRCRRSSREMTSLKPSGWQPQPGWYSFMPFGNSKRDWCSWLSRCTYVFIWHIYIYICVCVCWLIHIHIILDTYTCNYKYIIDSYMKKYLPHKETSSYKKNGKSFWESPSGCRGRVHVSFYMLPWLRMCHMTISARCSTSTAPCFQDPASKTLTPIRPSS